MSRLGFDPIWSSLGIELDIPATPTTRLHYQQTEKTLDVPDGQMNVLYEIRHSCKTFKGCGLTHAVKTGKIAQVRRLLQLRADPNAQYEIIGGAGANRIPWIGTAVAGAVASGRRYPILPMLELLVEFGANVNGKIIKYRGEPACTLLYEAARKGFCEVVRYLLEASAQPDIGCKVPHRYRDGDMMTPVDIASERGHAEIVSLLLDNVNKDQVNDLLHKPLDLAIKFGSYDVISVLTVKGDRVFQDPLVFHQLFSNERDPQLLAAAVNGFLSGEPEFPKTFTNKDIRPYFLRLLGTPGCESFTRAIFRPCEFITFDDATRKEVRFAKVSNGMTVAEGPPQKKKIFKAAGQDDNLRQRLNRFRELLCPESGGDLQLVEFRHCILPLIHKDLEVLFVMAMSDPRKSKVWDEEGILAIMRHGWKEAKYMHQWATLLELVDAILNVVLAFTVRHQPQEGRCVESDAALVVIGILWVCWLRAFGQEVLQFVGLRLLRHVRHYFSKDNIADVLQLALSFSVLFIASFKFDHFCGSDELRLMLGINGFSRWARMVNFFSVAKKDIGIKTLPAQAAVQSILGVGLISFCYFVGFFHFYYSLGIQNFSKSFWLSWNTGFLLDFDYSDLQDINPQSTIDGKIVTEEDDPIESWHWIVRLWVLMCTTSIAIVLLNILIGVLGIAYATQHEIRLKLFNFERGKCVFLYYLRHSVKRGCVKRCSARVAPGHDGLNDFDYLWYCQPARIGERPEEDAQVSSLQCEVRDLRSDISQLHTAMLQMQEESRKMKALLLAGSRSVHCSRSPSRKWSNTTYHRVETPPELELPYAAPPPPPPPPPPPAD